METLTARSLNDLPFIAEKLIQLYGSEIVYAFYGKMGSGKTTFIKEICKQLGVSDVITSPTFAIINEYTAAHEEKLYHFDFYRINNQEEVFDFGYEEYFYSGNKCFIEWPELIEKSPSRTICSN
jgi:tRNA threonylcarbamoyladenosine biosynthesis protein TsaE